MTRAKTYILGLGTFVSAMAIGYVMQFGLTLPRQHQAEEPAEITVTGITDTSSAGVPPMQAGLVAKPTPSGARPVLASLDAKDASSLPISAEKPASAPPPARSI